MYLCLRLALLLRKALQVALQAAPVHLECLETACDFAPLGTEFAELHFEFLLLFAESLSRELCPV